MYYTIPYTGELYTFIHVVYSCTVGMHKFTGTLAILAFRSWKVSAFHITAEKETILCNCNYTAFWFPVQIFHFSTL